MKRALFLASLCFSLSAMATQPGNNGGGNGGCGVGQQTNGCGSTTPGNGGAGGAGGAGGSAAALAASQARAEARASAIAAQQQAQAQRQAQQQAQRVNTVVKPTQTVNITMPETKQAPTIESPIKSAPAETTTKEPAVAEKPELPVVVPQDPRRPVSTAYAPAVTATSSCLGGASFGVQFDRVGMSGGGNSVIGFCESIAIADVAYRAGDVKTGDEVMCAEDKYRKARARAGRPCAADKEENGKRAESILNGEAVTQRQAMPWQAGG